MGDRFEVVPETLNDEARHWRANHEVMNRVWGEVISLDLAPEAFSAGEGSEGVSAEILYDRYQSLLHRMIDLTSQAGVEFNQLGGALNRAAESYGRTDLDAEELLRTVYGDEPS